MPQEESAGSTICPECGEAKQAGADVCRECENIGCRELLQAMVDEFPDRESVGAPETQVAEWNRWQPLSVNELGKLLPHYEIVELIGRGGMGAVYRGRQASLDRHVAIKLLPGALAKDGAEHYFVERFFLEAQALAKLNHPGIVTVHDFGKLDGGHLFFVMEHVDGIDLASVLQKSASEIPVEFVAAVLIQILNALEYAHGNGIVHRDIKPQNILIDRHGRVKIADFGLAKRIGVGPENGGYTQSGLAVGTPDYMAPESQDPLSSCDHRADIYACGVVLYQLLTRKLPRGKFDSISEFRAGSEKRFERVVEKALQGNPERRYQTADEFRIHLERVLNRMLRGARTGESSLSLEKLARGAAFPELRANEEEEIVGKRFIRKPLAITLCSLLVFGAVVFTTYQFTVSMPSARPGIQTEEPGMGEGRFPSERVIDGNSYFVWEGRRVSLGRAEKNGSPEDLRSLLEDLDSLVEGVEKLTGISQEPNFTVVGSPTIKKGNFVWNNKQLKLWPELMERFVGDYSARKKFSNFHLSEFACFTLSEEISGSFAVPAVRKEISRLPFTGMMLAAMIEVIKDEQISWHPESGSQSQRFSEEFLRYQTEWKESGFILFGSREARGFDQKAITAGAMLEIEKEFGPSNFLQRFFKNELPQLTPAETVQGVFDNFYLSASRAAESDLYEFFDVKLGLPVSESAVEKWVNE